MGRFGLIILLCFTSSYAYSVNLAGDIINNNAQINFQVEGLASPQITASVEFAVDRKLDINVQSQLNAPLEASVGASNVAIPFVVTNLSNTPVGVLLAANASTSWTSNHQVFNTNLAFNNNAHRAFVDINDNGLYEPDIDTEQFIAELNPSAVKTVFIVTDMPTATVSANDFAAVSLIAQLSTTGTIGNPNSVQAINNDDKGNVSPAGQFANGTSSSQGSPSSTSKNQNMGITLSVFADTNGDIDSSGNNDTPSNGQHSDTSGYALTNTPLSINKSAQAIDGTGNPSLAIAGNFIRYQLNISVRNTTTGILINDVMPEGTIYKASSLTLDGNALTDSADGDAGQYLSTTKAVEVAINQMNAGDTHQVVFDVLIE